MRSLILGAALAAFMSANATAQVGSWLAEVEEDPFDNKGRLTLAIMDSFTTGLLIQCEQESDEITVRWASPFPYDQSAPPSPIIALALAIDTGEKFESASVTGILGTGNIGFDAPFEGDEAREILAAFAGAKSKLYVKIGEMSPSQFSARGSTRAANKALDFCFPKPAT